MSVEIKSTTSYYVPVMEEQNSQKSANQERVELVIKVLSPALDLILAVGERISRKISPGDPDYYPVGNSDDSNDHSSSAG